MLAYRSNTNYAPPRPAENNNDAVHCCPRCGYNSDKEKIVSYGDWTADPRGYLMYQGKIVEVTAQQAQIAYALISAKGRTLRSDAILNSVDSDSGSNTVQVQVCRLRTKFLEVAGKRTIENVRSRGYRWTLPPDFSMPD